MAQGSTPIRIAPVRVAPVRVAIALLFLALALAIGFQRQTIVVRTIERDGAVAQVGEFRAIATDETVPPDAKGKRAPLTTTEAKEALLGLARDRRDARAALDRVTVDTKAVKTRAARADTDLARTQAGNVRAFARAAPVIAALRKVKPSGNAVADAATIADVTQQPWKAWR